MRSTPVARVLAPIVAAVLAFGAADRARAQSRYQLPPQVVVDILDARPLPGVAVSPSRQQIALIERASMPGIADLSQPMLRLAGARVNPKTNGPQRPPSVVGISLKQIADGKTVKLVLPPRREGRLDRVLPEWATHRVHRDEGRRDRPLGRGCDDGSGETPHAGDAECHDGPGLRVGERLEPPVQGRSRREGAASKGDRGAGWPQHPGKRREGGAGQHVRGSAEERPRRSAVRTLLHEPVGAGKCRHGRADARRKACDLRHRDRLAEWGVHPRVAAEEALLAPGSLPGLREGRRSLEQDRQARSHDRRPALE